MSIQFLCVSCRKPIEVDDQWALQRAECPYCHDVITVPGMSTYHEPGVPVATPVEPAAFAPYPQDRIEPVHPAPPNRLAIVALALACSTLLLMFVICAYAATKIDGVNPDGKPYSAQEIQEQSESTFQSAIERGESWPIVTSVGMLMCLIAWCAGLICSLVALSRPTRRGLSITALVVSLFPVLLFVVALV